MGDLENHNLHWFGLSHG